MRLKNRAHLPVPGRSWDRLVVSCPTAFGRENAIAAIEASLSKRRLATQFPTFSLTKLFPATGRLFILLPTETGVTDSGDFSAGQL